MGKVRFEISTSLDGYMAGPDQSVEQPLGTGGERLHEWVVGLASWRAAQGLDGGASGTPDDEIAQESFRGVGAYVMGRKMFGGGPGPWAVGDDAWRGWWGEEPPFHVPVFVLTNHPREPLEMAGGTTFTFVTDGIESALERARAAAGDGDVKIAGGAETIRQYLAAGLVDEFQLSVAPVVLGAGERPLDGLDGRQPALELTRVVDSPTVTHLRYRVVRE